MRKPALPGQTSDMSNIRKNQKVLQLFENRLYHGNHPKCQTSEKPKVLQTSERQLFQGKHPMCQTSEKLKSAANMRKPALPGQTSDISNIRCFKHPKNQKVLQTCENQLFQGKHPMCQTSEKPKSAANMRKPALPGQTSDMSNIRKTKKCCKHTKTSFTRANIRYVKHPKKPKSAAIIRKPALPWQTADMPNIRKTKSAANIRKAAFPGQTSDVSNIRKTKKCCKHAKTSFTRANIRYFKHPMFQTSEKPKSAANMRKPAFPGQTSDVSNIRKTKKCCKHAQTSFTRANI